ncbi:hypothetical protein ACR9E3_16875 [Actinomycetospora sp. C-140]
MSWECTFCGREERPDGKVIVDAVCHHCGAVMCRDDQYVLWDTDVLGRATRGRWAVHCSSCRREHHRFALPGLSRFAR